MHFLWLPHEHLLCLLMGWLSFLGAIDGPRLLTLDRWPAVFRNRLAPLLRIEEVSSLLFRLFIRPFLILLKSSLIGLTSNIKFELTSSYWLFLRLVSYLIVLLRLALTEGWNLAPVASQSQFEIPHVRPEQGHGGTGIDNWRMGVLLYFSIQNSSRKMAESLRVFVILRVIGNINEGHIGNLQNLQVVPDSMAYQDPTFQQGEHMLPD